MSKMSLPPKHNISRQIQRQRFRLKKTESLRRKLKKKLSRRLRKREEKNYWKKLKMRLRSPKS